MCAASTRKKVRKSCRSPNISVDKGTTFRVLNEIGAHSSAGRAIGLHPIGRRFKPCCAQRRQNMTLQLQVWTDDERKCPRCGKPVQFTIDSTKGAVNYEAWCGNDDCCRVSGMDRTGSVDEIFLTDRYTWMNDSRTKKGKTK